MAGGTSPGHLFAERVLNGIGSNLGGILEAGREEAVYFVRSPRILEISMNVLRIVVAILLPPLGVFLQVGFRGLNILLTLLGYIPGLVHAVWVIARK